jgi:ribonuclease D
VQSEATIDTDQSTRSTLVTTQAALDAAVEAMSAHEVIAVDTEFIREKTYYAQLCLVQIAYGDEVALIDPLSDIDLQALGALFCESDVLKVFHSGGQDLEILYHLFGRPVAPIFDTQCAAALLGTAEQISYSGLVKTILDVPLKKVGSFTQWAQRPLTEAQLSYAADDVAYLLQAYPLIRRQLAQLGRERWLDEEFAYRASEAFVKEIDPREAYRFVKRVSTLSPRQVAVVREVAAWRQIQAMQMDRPRRHVLPDETIVEIARRQPRSVEGLENIRGLTKLGRRQAQQILSAVRAGVRVPDDELPDLRSKHKPTVELDASVRLAHALVVKRAKENQIAPNVLANHAMLEEFVRTPDSRAQLMQGWRRMLIGNELFDLVGGDIALYLDNGKVKTMARTRRGQRKRRRTPTPEAPDAEKE